MFPLSDSIKTHTFPFLKIFLIGVTIYVFFQELLAPDFDTFIKTYALIPSHINMSDWSTFTAFVTAIFLHAGFLHIITNMWFLWIFGDAVEEYLGHFFFLILYFLSGIAGNVLQYFLMPHSALPMLGASGAIAGVLGAYYALFPYAKIKTIIPIFFLFTIADISAPFMLGYWFVLQLFSGFLSLSSSTDMGGVAFWAHIGGFITGLIIGRMFKGSSFRLSSYG